jgi:monothiol glutaredoxin
MFRITSLVARQPLLRRATTPSRAAAPLTPIKYFSSDSDPAFAPKRKDGLDEQIQDDVHGMLQNLVDDAKEKKRPLLFMKGTPAQPQCGFSMQVVRVLHAEGAEFDAVNVLEDALIREGVKSFSEWPTIPQLYVDGEFLGGCDVVTNMHQEGELNALLLETGCITEE